MLMPPTATRSPPPLAVRPASTTGGHARSPRQSFVHIYDRQYSQAAAVLDAADRVSRNGDSQLSTRQWVAARMQAERF